MNASLWLDRQGLALYLPSRPHGFRLDPKILPGRLSGSNLLLRACGLQGKSAAVDQRGLQILDLFGGFAVDALTIAGYDLTTSVTVTETNIMIWLLARDLVSQCAGNVDLVCTDGLKMLQDHARQTAWDVIYLDPMFSPRSKSALPNLPAQILRQLSQVTPPTDIAASLELALESAAKVVLKRPAKSPVLGTPNYQLTGKMVRFDVYK